MTPTDRRTFLELCGLVAGVGTVGAGTLVASGAQESEPSGWPAFQHDAANTGSTGNSIGVDYPMVASSTRTRIPFHARPAIVDTVAYFASGAITAVDLSTGSIQWETEYSAGDVEIGEDLAPTVVGDRLLASGGGVVTALSTSDGSVLWQYETDSLDSSSTAVADGTVYVASDTGWCHAISLDDGSEQWSFETAGDTHTYRLFGVPAVADGTVFVPSSAGVHALDAETGDQQWNGPATEFPPVVADGAVYLVQGDDLLSVDAATGEERWRAVGEYDVRSTPVVADGRVFVRRYGNTTHAFDAADGTEQWTAELGADNYKQLVVAGDTLYVPSGYGLYQQLVAADVATGEERWRFYVPDTVPLDPVGVFAVDGSLYFLRNGDVYELVDGPRSFRWQFTLPGADSTDSVPDAPPVASPYGVYVTHQWDDAMLLTAIDDEKGGMRWRTEAGGTLDVDDSGVYAVSWRTARAYDFVETDDLFVRERERWTRTFEKHASTPVLADGDAVYVGSERTDLAAAVYALDPGTGEQRWSFTGKTCPGMATVAAGPALLGENVLAGTENRLWALSRPDGALDWAGEGPIHHVATSESQAFAAGERTLRAFSTDGEVQWNTDLDGDVEALASDPSRVYALLSTAESNTLVAFTADDGTSQWTYADQDGRALTGPHVTEGAVYVGGGTTVRALTPADGTEIRRYECHDQVLQPPATTAESLYAVTGGANVYAFDRTE